MSTPPIPTRTELLETALAAAHRAADIIVAARRDRAFTVSAKNSADNLVTTTDIAAEQAICATIRARFPHHRFLAEESAPTVTPADLHEPLWIVDPIDGTTNFIYGQTHVAVSIACALAGEVQVGVVHAPFLSDTYAAVRGGGATRNGHPIHAAATTALDHSLIATGFPYGTGGRAPLVRRLGAVLERCRDVRRFGAAAIDVCMVAAGTLDGYYEDVHPWDIAAGGLIAREAGAVTGHIHPRPERAPLPSDLDGTNFIVAAPGIFNDLRGLLAGAF